MTLRPNHNRPLAPPDQWGSSWNHTVTASASTSTNQTDVVIRVHSNSSLELPVTIAILPGMDTGVWVGGGLDRQDNLNLNPNLNSRPYTIVSVASAMVLAAPSLFDTVNTPAQPHLVSPAPLTVDVDKTKGVLRLTLPSHSFVVVELKMKGE